MTKARIGKAMCRRIAFAAAVVLLTSCASQGEVAPAATRLGGDERQPAPQAVQPATPSETEQPSTPRTRQEIIERGTSVFTGTNGVSGVSPNEAGDINLQFDATDIKQFVEVVLGDILHENFVIDPGVMGTVTMRTPRPLQMNEVLPLFEQVLEMNRAALVRAGSIYRVVPLSAATRRNVTPSTVESATAGFTTRVIPLQFISAQEMQKILESIVADPDSVQIDAARNLVIVSGTAQEVATVQDTVDLFDVDWLRGMSVGLYPLEHVEPKTLQNELTQVLGAALGQSDSVLGGIVRLVPLERLTSLLVVSSTSAALREVETWIRRLDQPGESAGRRLYVYPMQNAKATDVGEVLGDIFGSSSRRSTRSSSQGETGASQAARLAPGLSPIRIGPGGAQPFGDAPLQGLGAGRVGASPVPTPRAPASTAASETDSESRPASDVTVTGNEQIQIIADDVRNALVILATPEDYRMLEAALRRLDVVPLQVLIEARILSVTLRNDLNYGVEWFFQNAIDAGRKQGTGALDLGSAGIGPLAPGFSYTVIDDVEQVRAAINLLQAESKVDVLSSPSLMVLDNQTATINVGDEIPVPARQSISNIGPEAPTVNEITYRQTGVTLSVTPRVNSSGLVTMEIRQEVSNAATTTSSNIDAPTIQNRQIDSVVAINSGDTIVLGGLIQNQHDDGTSGFPFLHRIPVLGKLFGATGTTHARTELLVLITPRVVRSPEDARRVTEEIRRKLPEIRLFEADEAAEAAKAAKKADRKAEKLTL